MQSQMKYYISKIRMITILKLYKSTIIPSLLYGCETWIPTENDKQNLLNIQLSIIRKIVKVLNQHQKYHSMEKLENYQ